VESLATKKIIDAFKNQEIDILVGTQMLAKGLHFDNVSLVWDIKCG
jgi:primosomal protein N' (replication factor Y)